MKSSLLVKPVNRKTSLDREKLRIFEREKLVEISAKLTEHFTDLGKLLDEIVALAAEAIDCNRITVWLSEEDKEQIVLRAAAFEAHRPWIGEHYYKYGEDLPGVVAKTGKPVCVKQGKDHPAWIGKYDQVKSIHEEDPGSVPLMVMPMKVRERVIGVIKLSRPNPRDDRLDGCFNQYDEHFAMALSNHIAILVENAGLWEIQKGISEGMKAIIEALNETDIDKLIASIPVKISQIFKATASSIFILEEKSGNFFLQGTSSTELETDVGKAFYLPGEGLTGWVGKTGRSVRLFDISSRPETEKIDSNIKWARKHVEVEYPTRFMAVPLCLQENHRAFGVIRAVRTKGERPFTQQDEDILQALARNLATSIEHRRLKQREADIAIFDALKLTDLNVQTKLSRKENWKLQLNMSKQLMRLLFTDRDSSFFKAALFFTKQSFSKKESRTPPMLYAIYFATVLATWTRLREMETFNKIGQTLLSELGLNEMLKKAIDIASQMLMCKQISVWLKDETGKKIILRANLNGLLRKIGTEPLFYQVGEGLTGGVAASGNFVRAKEARLEPGWLGKYNTGKWGHPEEPGSIPLMIIPLRTSREIVGVVRFTKPKRTIERHDGCFNETDERLAQAICQQISLAMEAQKLFEERQVAQEENAKRNRLAAIGELARGAAHELCNPLAAIKGITEELIKTTPGEDEKLEDLIVIQDSVNQSIRIVNGLRQFARLAIPSFEKISLNKEIDKAIKMVIVQENVPVLSIKKNYALDLPMIDADPSQLRQVFINILSNSIQAMPQGGRIVIETAWEKQSKAVTIKFSDSGLGMNGSELFSAMNPFFTTKAEKGGSGLGLAICYGIIQQHQGNIRLDSSPGEGTDVIMTLPLRGKA